jgi:uncharacterized protein
MIVPDYEGAQHYALSRLEAELPPHLTYHSLEHTREQVLPAAERLATDQGIQDGTLQLLRTAVCFHDLGFIEEAADHEGNSIRIARQVLPGYGFQPFQVNLISGLIQATRLPQTPLSFLEMILCDADLDTLGHPEFLRHSLLLRAEWQALDRQTTDEEWYRIQLNFILGHSYFTAAARELRDQGKARNVNMLRRLLAEL